MAVDPEFSRIFKTFLEPKAKYCKICLTTDTPLVQPKNVKKLLEYLKTLGLDLTFDLVCIYCEGRASAAYELIKVLYYAKDFFNLIECINANKNVLQKIKKHKEPDLHPFIKKPYIKCSRQLTEQKKLHLNRTETLQIDLSAPPPHKDRKNSDEIVISDSEDECVILPMINPKPIEQLLEKPIQFQYTVESEDTVDPLAINEPPDSTPETPSFTPMPVDGKETILYLLDETGKLTLLHPLVKKNQGNYEAPTLTFNTNPNSEPKLISAMPMLTNINNGKFSMTNIIDGNKAININNANVFPKIISANSVIQGVINSENSLPIITNVNSGNAIPINNQNPLPINSFPIHINSDNSLPIITNINKGTKVNSGNPLPIITNINNGKSVPLMPNNRNTTPLITNINSGYSLPIITNALSLKEPPQTLLQLTNEEAQSILRKRLSKMDSGEEPEEKRVVSETDWEDKIPMDLISYADAPKSQENKSKGSVR